MSYPDFLCIGAQKAGTTWLHHNMRSHPQIWLPLRKEVHYFDKKFDIKIEGLAQDQMETMGNEYIQEERLAKGRPPLSKRLQKYTPAHIWWELKYRYWPRSDKWYESLFNRPDDLIAGDYTPAYSMLDEQAVAYIHNIMPMAKIIFIMRNPIERAWSQARMDRAAHAGKLVTDIDKDSFISHFHSPGALMRTDYMRTLINWEKHFGQQQVLPLFFDDIINNPRQMMRNVYEFLQVDAADECIPESVGKKVHAGQALDVPADLYTELFKLYETQLQQLAERFSGYPQAWLKDAREKVAAM